MQPRKMRALAAAAPASRPFRFILGRLIDASREQAIIHESATGNAFSKASSCSVSVASILPEKNNAQKRAVPSAVNARSADRTVIDTGLELSSILALPIYYIYRSSNNTSDGTLPQLHRQALDNGQCWWISGMIY